MYITKTKQIVLEIPKCGSRSLVAAATQQHGKRYLKHHGHKTLAEMLELISPNEGDDLEVIAVVRDPAARFVSQVHNYCQIKSCGVDDALKACAEQSHIIFKPQWKFLACSFPDTYSLRSKVFSIEDIEAAQQCITGDHLFRELHKNKTKQKTLRVDKLKTLPRFGEAVAHFEEDYYVYGQVLGNADE